MVTTRKREPVPGEQASQPREPAEVKQGSASRARQPPRPVQARVSEPSSFLAPRRRSKATT